ncbi:MAG: hypothetical protein ACOYOK_15010 [Pseudobdellovibrionaceae bacterium]
MQKSAPIKLNRTLYVNGNIISSIIIGKHYLQKHSLEVTEDLIILLVCSLHGLHFKADSISAEIEYYATDIELDMDGQNKIFRLVWLFEGEQLEIIGIINAYRVRKKRK